MKTTERGWIGHHVLGDRCLFRRNILVEHKGVKIVVSSIGNMIDIHAVGYPNEITIQPITQYRDSKIYFESLVFHAKYNDPYNDADVERLIPCNVVPAADLFIRDDRIWNTFHDNTVKAVKTRLITGDL